MKKSIICFIACLLSVSVYYSSVRAQCDSNLNLIPNPDHIYQDVINKGSDVVQMKLILPKEWILKPLEAGQPFIIGSGPVLAYIHPQKFFLDPSIGKAEAISNNRDINIRKSIPIEELFKQDVFLPLSKAGMRLECIYPLKELSLRNARLFNTLNKDNSLPVIHTSHVSEWTTKEGVKSLIIIEKTEVIDKESKEIRWCYLTHEVLAMQDSFEEVKRIYLSALVHKQIPAYSKEK